MPRQIYPVVVVLLVFGAACTKDAASRDPLLCGNGVLDPEETCDPPSSCPTDCNDGVHCTTDTLVGRANDCTAACQHQVIRQCLPGDGCCALGCRTDNDSDCLNFDPEGVPSCSGAHTVLVPLVLRSKTIAQNGHDFVYESGIYISNLVNATGGLTVEYLDQSSSFSCTDQLDLAAGGKANIYVPNSCLGNRSEFLGSVVISSACDISVTVNIQTDVSSGATASDPIRVGSATGVSHPEASVFVTQLIKNHAGYTTWMAIQNAGPVSKTVEAKIYEGASHVTDESCILEPGRACLLQQAANPALQADKQYSARVSTTDGTGPVAVLSVILAPANNYQDSALFALNGESVGDDLLFLPRVLRDYYGGQSGIRVQNIDPTHNAEIEFEYHFGGQTCTTSATVPPMGAHSVYMGDADSALDGCTGAGSATVRVTPNPNDVSVVATVNEDFRDSEDGELVCMGASYNGVYADAAANGVVFNQMMSVYEGWNSGWQVQLAEEGTAKCRAVYSETAKNGSPPAQEEFVLSTTNGAVDFDRFVPDGVKEINPGDGSLTLRERYIGSTTVVCDKKIAGVGNYSYRDVPGATVFPRKYGDTYVTTGGLAKSIPPPPTERQQLFDIWSNQVYQLYRDTDFSNLYQGVDPSFAVNASRGLSGQALMQAYYYEIAGTPQDLDRAIHNINTVLEEHDTWCQHWGAPATMSQLAFVVWWIWNDLPSSSQQAFKAALVKDADFWTFGVLQKIKEDPEGCSIPAEAGRQHRGGSCPQWLSCENGTAQNQCIIRTDPNTEAHLNDTRAEENGWNAQFLAIARAMLPEHPNAEAWHDAARCFAFHSISRGEEIPEVCDIGVTRTLGTTDNDSLLGNHNKFPNPAYAIGTIYTLQQAAFAYQLHDPDDPIPNEFRHGIETMTESGIWVENIQKCMRPAETNYQISDHADGIAHDCHRGEDWGDVNLFVATCMLDFWGTLDGDSDASVLLDEMLTHYAWVASDELRIPVPGPVSTMEPYDQEGVSLAWWMNLERHAQLAAKHYVLEHWQDADFRQIKGRFPTDLGTP